LTLLFLSAIFICIVGVVLVVQAASRPSIILYALALVVSLVGINIHIGVTIYLSRLILIIFLISLLVRSALGKGDGFQFQFDSRFINLFALTLLVHLISVLFSSHTSDGFRQMFIYMSMMAIFTTVVIVGTRTEFIIKAIKLYLALGVVQGLYGIYQVIGAPMSWPTYQTFMAGIPTANDRLQDGYYYFGAYNAFRATGFFPEDVSHYSGYMAGVLLLAISLVAYNRRSFFPYIVILIGGMGLLLSLSRSGIVAFIVFGLPSLLFLLRHVRAFGRRFWRSIALSCLSLAILGGVIAPLVLPRLNIDVPNTLEIVSTRLMDVLNPGVDAYESMEGHILTRLMALDAFASSPVIGVGLGVNDSPWYSERYHELWGGAHSYHLDILGQTGILGAGLVWTFMGLVGLYMWHGLKIPCAGREERILLAGLVAAYITIILGNFFYHYYLMDFVWFLMGCGVALSRGIQRQRTAPANVEALLSPRIGVASSHAG
jgi:hypothetical protein